MLYDPQNFLHSYCTWAAARAATILSPALVVAYCRFGGSAPFNLFLNQADEDFAADNFASVRIYGGAKERNNPKPTIAVNIMTVGKSDPDAGRLAHGLFRAFVLDNQEKELRARDIPGLKLDDNSSDGTWRLISAVTVSPPGQIGRDERGRVKISCNFDLGYFKSA
jgi:hypothetical protein